MTPLACNNQTRRTLIRNSPRFTGFDYVEVSEDHLTLKVYVLGQLPQAPLTPENLRIDGGRRIRNIQVVSVQQRRFADADLDDYLEITVDRFGDFSTYTLRAVQRDTTHEPPVWQPHPAFDPAYNQLDFTFTAGCATPLDCPSDEACPPTEHPPTAINYLAKDYASFRQLIFDRLAVTLPDWQNRLVPDLGVTLVELLAYRADYLSYYQDAVATEAYLDTARQRISVRRHARLVDYSLHEGYTARALVVIGTNDTLEVNPAKAPFRLITAPAPHLPAELTTQQLARLAAHPSTVFEAIAPVTLYAGEESIHFYTWGNSECCLPQGATSATLDPAQRTLHIQVGDILIFEEVLGPHTGLAADRDPSHRHAVRLTLVQPDTDPLTGTSILHIEWAKSDALPFPLCLSVVGQPPDCLLLENVSVARGNVVVVDHGQLFSEELPLPQSVETPPSCDGPGSVAEITHSASPFRPRLSRPGLAYSEPLDPGAPAQLLLKQDPHQAVPLISLSGTSLAWMPTPDLIESRATDQQFVVEIDNDRQAQLRFGDATHGALPPLTQPLTAHYRVGGGPEGNVGPEAIAHVLWDTPVTGIITDVRNPLSARGGQAPQSIQDAKLFAPHAFRKRLERAVTADDYAAIAQREFPLEVQRATAQLRWNGSWYEVLVAIDAFGSSQASLALLKRIERRLEIYRRLGHDLRVQAANRVPVRIVLDVCIKPVYLRAHVLADLYSQFSAALLPNGKPAYFHPDNLTFGAALYLSQVVSRAQAVSGVESVAVRTFERMFDGPNGEIASGFIPFGPFEIALCDNDPSFPENGQIEFNIGGGR